MMLKIYNSLTKQKETFTPLKAGHVGLYVCGVTVYDHCHIGHARTYLAFDVVVRFLRWQGYHVHYVRNITDVDDKIIRRAQENDESIEALVERFTHIMHEEFSRLGTVPPDEEPRAIQSIPDMLAMIGELLDKGFAYVADNGDVYYAVSQFADYGKLSGQHIEQLRSGERVDVNPDKRDPLDFVLWKAAKPGEPAWESPWGSGRPGWHIECSAMTKRCLGSQFDIHAGGSDLRFPHHENEIAQSEAANGCTFANYWMHSGMVRVNADKMSKSLGNFFVIRDVLLEYPAEAVRYFLISAHYRSELNYSDDNLRMAKASLSKLYLALRGLPVLEAAEGIANAHEESFVAAMQDDFNTPEALAVLFDLARQVNRLRETDVAQAAQHAYHLKRLAGVLGLLQQDPDAFLASEATGDSDQDAQIDALLAARAAARAARDWSEADRIRDELDALGVIIEDSAAGTTWRYR